MNGSSQTQVRLDPQNGAGFELTFPGVAITACTTAVSGGVPYLIVCTVDANDFSTVHRVHDTTGDDAPEYATLTTVFTSSPTPAYFASVVRAETKWFLLDVRCQDVWTASDVSGLPGVLSSTLFARSANHSTLLDVRVLDAKSDDVVHGVQSRADLEQAQTPGGPGVVVAADANGDGVADSVAVDKPTAVAGLRWAPYDGQGSIDATVVEAGTVQVWLLDAAGDEDQLLGQATASEAGVVGVQLSPSLSEGDGIRVRMSTENAGSDFEVVDARPQLTGYIVGSVTTGQSAQVTVTGVNLSTSTVFELWNLADSESSATVLAFTLTNSESAVLTIPALTSEWVGRAGITAREPPQDETHGMPLVSVDEAP